MCGFTNHDRSLLPSDFLPGGLDVTPLTVAPECVAVWRVLKVASTALHREFDLTRRRLAVAGETVHPEMSSV
jgi:hypothetical protein